MEKLNHKEAELFQEQIQTLSTLLNETLEFLKENLVSFNNQKLSDYKAYFLMIIGKFRMNTESLIGLLPFFKQDHRHKLSLALILRCICSDILTALYLLSFIDNND
ncbi:MAG: hypothetical protein K2Q22_07925, partial [Cytophagales bacterium]|nr:hypothetical protein [Cytophagales bacterium]